MAQPKTGLSDMKSMPQAEAGTRPLHPSAVKAALVSSVNLQSATNDAEAASALEYNPTIERRVKSDGSKWGRRATDRIPIVIVDDDPLFRESLRLNLEDEGYPVQDFDNGFEALNYLGERADIGVVLLDWKMPGIDGLEVLHRLRATGSRVPVIFLTVLSDEIYEEAALEGGAVDFVEKSRSFLILLKRIALIETGIKAKTSEDLAASRTPNEQVVGDLTIWADSKRAVWKGKTVELTVREFDIVVMLLENRGHNVTYREVYDSVHGKGFLAGDGSEGLRNTVRAIIKRIRQKFRAVDEEFEEIENYPGFGYRWRRGPGD